MYISIILPLDIETFTLPICITDMLKCQNEFLLVSGKVTILASSQSGFGNPIMLNLMTLSQIMEMKFDLQDP